MATLTKRPANLPDKTYGAPVGYAYFDIFNTGSRWQLPCHSPRCPQMIQYSSPGRTVWRWSLQRSAQASLEKCVSRSGSRHSVPETRPALRFTSKILCGWLWDRLQWYDRKSYDGSDVDRMDDDYHDFFRQDISEGKDDDEDKDIPSVSIFIFN